MKHKNSLLISIVLLLMVLIGVTIIEPVTSRFDWLAPFVPMIVITGFFTFLVSASLFIYVIINNLNNK